MPPYICTSTYIWWSTIVRCPHIDIDIFRSQWWPPPLSCSGRWSDDKKNYPGKCTHVHKMYKVHKCVQNVQNVQMCAKCAKYTDVHTIPLPHFSTMGRSVTPIQQTILWTDQHIFCTAAKSHISVCVAIFLISSFLPAPLNVQSMVWGKRQGTRDLFLQKEGYCVWCAHVHMW